MRLLLIRHAESTWNAEERWQGQADPPLSARGRRQAGTLARGLRDVRFDALLCSDLRRARETAEILGRGLGLVPRPDRRLRERDIGSLTGRRRDEIVRAFPDEVARLRSGDGAVALGGGESTEELEARVRAALSELRAAHPRGRLAVVTHGGVADLVVPGAALANAAASWVGADRLRRLCGGKGGT